MDERFRTRRPWGETEVPIEQAVDTIEHAWGSLAFAENFAPSGDERVRPPAGRLPASRREPLACGGSRPRQLGDEGWADLLARYEHVAGLVLAAQGQLVDRTGDGLMASFLGPVAAIRAAQRLQREAAELGVRVRAGVHIGEVLERDGSLRGVAVHVAAASWPRQRGVTCWCPRPSRTSWPGQASASPTAVSAR